MNKYIFNDNIYEDFDLYYNIKKQYNIIDEKILHNIYLLNIDINKENIYINNINININIIKNKFLIDTNQWSLQDSCNIKKTNEKIKNILEIHDIISQLNYQKQDHINNIKNFNNSINNFIQNNKKQETEYKEDKNKKDKNKKDENKEDENNKEENNKKENNKEENNNEENNNEENNNEKYNNEEYNNEEEDLNLIING